MRMFGGMLWPWMWVGGDEVRLPHHVRRWDADGVAVVVVHYKPAPRRKFGHRGAHF